MLPKFKCLASNYHVVKIRGSDLNEVCLTPDLKPGFQVVLLPASEPSSHCQLQESGLRQVSSQPYSD